MPITKHLTELRKTCRIHKGEIDPHTLLPVNKKGQIIHYGYRRCGILDCVNKNHWTLNIRQGRTITGDKPTPLFKRDPDITGEQLHQIAKPLFRGTEPKTCQVPNCPNPHRATNLCARHHTMYSKWRKANGIGRVRQDFTQNLPTVIPELTQPVTTKQRYCRAENCERPYAHKGFCKLHYTRWQRLQGAKW